MPHRVRCGPARVLGVLFVSMLIVFIVVAAEKFFVQKVTAGSISFIVPLALFTFFAVLAIMSYAGACYVHPGRLPLWCAETLYQPDLALSACVRCSELKPPFAHHCSRCGTCIDRMDHHCPWIGQCVGRGNHKLFLLFLVYSFASCFTFSCSAPFGINLLDAAVDIGSLFCFIFAVSFTLSLFPFALYSIKNAAEDTTTLQRMRLDSATTPLSTSSQATDISFADAFRNLCVVFGEGPCCSWLVPLPAALPPREIIESHPV